MIDLIRKNNSHGEKKLAEQKTDKPQKGEFIDLNSGEFKKKSNLGKIFLKYFLVSVIFFSFGFLDTQPIKNHLSNSASRKR